MRVFKILLWTFTFAIILCMAAGTFYAVNKFELCIEPFEPKVTLEYNTEYSCSGAKVLLYGEILFKDGREIDAPVNISGEVDTTKTGEYKLDYSAEYLWWTAQASSFVEIKDTQSPEIKLESIEGYYTVFGFPYKEEGFSAADGYDGDITNLVKAEEKDGIVYYTVADSSGNIAKAEREIFYVYPEPPVITLLGETKIEIRADGEYKEAGFTAIDHFGKDITANVKVNGEIDMTKAGEYVLEYVVTDDYGKKATAKRIIEVIPVPPKIKLEGEREYSLFLFEEYTEKGFSAFDYTGKELTEDVIVTGKVNIEEPGEYVIEYTVTDDYRNTVAEKRVITVKDKPAPPTLELLGSPRLKLYKDEKYIESGFNATAFGKDGSEYVTVEGEVPQKVGTYTITYTLDDGYGQIVTAERIVMIVDYPQNRPENAGDKIIYLTFDDGPSQHTGRLLEILDKYNVKATFFVVDSGNYDTMRDIVDQGHSIGIHSVTHDYGEIYSSADAFFEDLYGMQDIIYRETGVLTTLMRFPGGSSNTVSSFNPGIMTYLTDAVEEAGFQYFDWHVSSEDAGGIYTESGVYNKVTWEGSWYVNRDKSFVVLQHDTKSFSIDAVDDIILWGLENGYVFMPLDEDSPKAHHGINN